MQTPAAFSNTLWKNSERILEKFVHSYYPAFDKIHLFMDLKKVNLIEKAAYI